MDLIDMGATRLQAVPDDGITGWKPNSPTATELAEDHARLITDLDEALASLGTAIEFAPDLISRLGRLSDPYAADILSHLRVAAREARDALNGVRLLGLGPNMAGGSVG